MYCLLELDFDSKLVWNISFYHLSWNFQVCNSSGGFSTESVITNWGRNRRSERSTTFSMTRLCFLYESPYSVHNLSGLFMYDRSEFQWYIETAIREIITWAKSRIILFENLFIKSHCMYIGGKYFLFKSSSNFIFLTHCVRA